MKRKIIIILVLISFPIGLSSCDTGDDTSQLLSTLNSMHYEYYPFPSEELTITEDIQINGTVIISSLALEVPEECASIDFCRPIVGFKDNYGAEGISLFPLSSEPYPPCILILTDVKLRFRTLVINEGGPPPPPEIKYSKYPVIQLMPPSDCECDSTQTRCDVDQVCYDNYFSYCLHCRALSQEECVCRDENGIYANGTYCRVVVGDDRLFSGECQNGECEIEW